MARLREVRARREAAAKRRAQEEAGAFRAGVRLVVAHCVVVRCLCGQAGVVARAACRCADARADVCCMCAACVVLHVLGWVRPGVEQHARKPQRPRSDVVADRCRNQTNTDHGPRLPVHLRHTCHSSLPCATRGICPLLTCTFTVNTRGFSTHYALLSYYSCSMCYRITPPLATTRLEVIEIRLRPTKVVAATACAVQITRTFVIVNVQGTT